MVNLMNTSPESASSPNHGRSRRHLSQPSSNPPPTRSNSVLVHKAHRLPPSNNRSVTTSLGSTAPATKTLRKRPAGKLPWLDGNAHSRPMPGAFDETELDDLSSITESQSIQKDAASNRESVSGSKPPIHDSDPRLRPYGSTQSISRKVSQSQSRRLSSASQVRPLPLRLFIPDQLKSPDAVGEQTEEDGGRYSPSAYSHSPRSDSTSVQLDRLPKKSTASYERLIEEPDKPLEYIPLEADQDLQAPETQPALLLSRDPSLALTPVGSKIISDTEHSQSPSSIKLPFASEIRGYHDGNFSSDPPTRSTSAQIPRRAVSDVGVPRRLTPSHHNGQRTNSMQGAVSSLQDLMEEALNVAADAARHNRTDDVATVLNEATIALRRASTVTGRMKEPLILDDIEAGISSSDDTADTSDISSGESDLNIGHKASADTVPTMSTGHTDAKQHTAIYPPFLNSAGERPRSERGDFDSRRPGDFYPESVLSISRFSPPQSYDGGRNKSRSTDTMHVELSTSEYGDRSMLRTPPQLYSPPSADSIIIDFAYVEKKSGEGSSEAARPSIRLGLPSGLKSGIGATSESSQPSEIRSPIFREPQSDSKMAPSIHELLPGDDVVVAGENPRWNVDVVSTTSPPIGSPNGSHAAANGPRKRFRPAHHHFMESSYYKIPVRDNDKRNTIRIKDGPGEPLTPQTSQSSHRNRQSRGLSDEFPSSRSHKYRRKPIAREWNTFRKRLTATIACANTILIGLIVGIYAGEVPKIQYEIADINHYVILGNVLLYIGLGITTLIFWPLPLLHGRKPYVLLSLALTLPLQFPQAIAVQSYRSPRSVYYVGLLLPRAISGLALGFANVNFIATLFDLFGASLQSSHPHQEIVDVEDPRRQGGGMGLWLGIWAWCFVGSLAVGFLLGSVVTAHLNPSWGFYFVVIILAVFLLMNVVAPETRRAPHRRSVLHYFDEEDNLKKKVARGEVMLHLSSDGPKYWWQEVFAGIRLLAGMLIQPGFFVLALYLAWVYALVVLVTLLLGALLSRDYLWRPQYCGLAVFALALGGLLAIPLTKANLFSRDRQQPPRTDSMTFQSRVSWSSHLVRRCIFTFALPIAGLAFVLSAKGSSVNWSGPTIISATVGFLATLAIAECVGLTMETFDTCDLQPGVNSKHRLQSMESVTRRRRTNYSSFPRVAAGVFAAQGLGFFLAAAGTAVSGRVTRDLGAQAATGVVAGVLLFATILLSLVLWRFRTKQVIPDHAFGTKQGSKDWSAADLDKEWKAVIVGNPSGKHRRMNLLETGRWSRWTEIRRLNKLSKHTL